MGDFFIMLGNMGPTKLIGFALFAGVIYLVAKSMFGGGGKGGGNNNNNSNTPPSQPPQQPK